jgi:hypothetical protein
MRPSPRPNEGSENTPQLGVFELYLRHFPNLGQQPCKKITASAGGDEERRYFENRLSHF